MAAPLTAKVDRPVKGPDPVHQLRELRPVADRLLDVGGHPGIVPAQGPERRALVGVAEVAHVQDQGMRPWPRRVEVRVVLVAEGIDHGRHDHLTSRTLLTSRWSRLSVCVSCQSTSLRSRLSPASSSSPFAASSASAADTASNSFVYTRVTVSVTCTS